MRKNKAFTLAEVLITLGIIGVVAALTVPTLVNGTNNAKVGPELASAVSTLENGIQQFMNDYNADYLSVAMKKAKLSTTDLSTLLGSVLFDSSKPYIKGSIMSSSIPVQANIIAWNGSASHGVYKPTSDGVLLANKSLITPSGDESTCDLSASTSSYCGIIFFTSGYQKKMNDSNLVIGRDVFKLWITNKGEVIPDGQVGFSNAWNTNSNCTESGMKDATASGVGCAGRIAANGWKVDY